VRLLDLPETAKNELAAGRITVGTARKLLTVQKIGDEKSVDQAVKSMIEGENPEDVVGSILSKDAYCMWGAGIARTSRRVGLGYGRSRTGRQGLAGADP